MRLRAVAMRRLLRAVAADRHAAPPPRMTTCVIGEEQRAGRPLTGLHMRKFFRADEPRQRLSDGEQKRVGMAPIAKLLKREGRLRIRARRYATENLSFCFSRLLSVITAANERMNAARAAATAIMARIFVPNRLHRRVPSRKGVWAERWHGERRGRTDRASKSNCQDVAHGKFPSD
jgi:hypothetical protein